MLRNRNRPNVDGGSLNGALADTHLATLAGLDATLAQRFGGTPFVNLEASVRSAARFWGAGMRTSLKPD